MRFYVDMWVHVFKVFLILSGIFFDGCICYLVSFDGCVCIMTFLIMFLIYSSEFGCTILSCSSVSSVVLVVGLLLIGMHFKVPTPMVVPLMIGIHLKVHNG